MTRVFGDFSRRSQPLQEENVPLTPEFRNRVLQLFITMFPLYQRSFGMDRSFSDFWTELREKLLYLLGQGTLLNTPRYDLGGEITDFLLGCSSDEHFLDFIEFAFQSYLIWRAYDSRTGNRVDPHALIVDVNTFLEVDDLPYYLTGFHHYS